MTKHYIAGGTIQLCPHSQDIAIISCSDDGIDKMPDRSLCQYASECNDDACPLLAHLQNFQ